MDIEYNYRFKLNSLLIFMCQSSALLTGDRLFRVKTKPSPILSSVKFFFKMRALAHCIKFKYGLDGENCKSFVFV